MRLLHTADWQIGRHYGRFAPEDALALAEARFSTVERLARLATEQAVAAVLVAGDVFDAQTVSDRTIRRLFNAMQGFAGPWILIPGNHDAALAESVWNRAKRLRAIPAHVEVLLEPGVYAFPQSGIAVLAAPLTQRQTSADLTAWFDNAESPEGLLRLGLAHGSVQGQLADDIDSPNPIAAERAARARLDYLALGDWHGLKRIDERTWYSGTPEQERFKNNGAGQALIVAFEQSGQPPRVTAHQVGEFQWHQWQETLGVDSDIDRLIERLEALPAPAVLALNLAGDTDLAGHQRLIQALAEAEARHRSVQYDLSALRLQPTDADIAALDADGYLGDVIDELRAQQSLQDDEASRDALVLLAGLLRERLPQAASAEESALGMGTLEREDSA